MRTALIALCLSASPTMAAPLHCEPLIPDSAGGRFLEEVTKMLRGNALEILLTGERRCVDAWAPEVVYAPPQR